MVRSKFGYRTGIPTLTSRKQQTKQLSFKDGVDTYKDNDDLTATELASAVDGRYIKIGRYKTRQGLDRYSVPIGEAINIQQTSTTGASTANISDTAVVAKKITIGSAGRVTRLDVNIKTATSPVGTVLVELYDNNAGAPGTLLGRGSIASSAITSSFAYATLYLVDAPAVTSSQIVWVVVKGQTGASGYQVS